MSEVTSGSATIRIGTVLNWDAFMVAYSQMAPLIGSCVETEVYIDLRAVKTIFPDGIIPLISTVCRYRDVSSTKLTVIEPESPQILGVAQRQSWLHFLDPERFRPGTDATTHTSLHPFSSPDELNPVISRCIDTVLKTVEFAPGAAEAFEWCLNEIADNVLQHAEAGGWLQTVAYPKRQHVIFSVCDAGVGVPTTMARAPQFSIYAGNDEMLLQQALRERTTSNPERGQGNGLAGCVALARASDGSFALASGGARLVLHGPAWKTRASSLHPQFPGTYVEVRLSKGRPIAVEDALWGHTPVPYTELRFENAEGVLEFRLREHAENFGNRRTGVQLRTYVMNLLEQHPGHPVQVDFKDVGLISSSFADEMFGKLAVRIGVLNFGRLIRLSNANSLCHNLVESAVRQRIAQSEDRGRPEPES